MDFQYFVITTTIDTKKGAERLANSLVKKKLVACAQIDGPLKSIYWWEEKLDSSEEWRVTLKAKSVHYAEIEKTIKKLHPYDLPQIIATPVIKGSREYLSWIDEISKD